MYVGRQITAPSVPMSFVYTRYCLPTLDENFSEKQSSDAWALFLDDFTSIGQIFLPSATMKSIL